MIFRSYPFQPSHKATADRQLAIILIAPSSRRQGYGGHSRDERGEVLFPRINKFNKKGVILTPLSIKLFSFN